MVVSLGVQATWLLLLALPIACIAWTVTHEEVFREAREYCAERSQHCRKMWQRKFFFVFTCEYCFSHYATIAVLLLTRYHLLFPDWRGYVIAGFSLVWVASFYMGIFGRLRLEIKSERLEQAQAEKRLAKDRELDGSPQPFRRS